LSPENKGKISYRISLFWTILVLLGLLFLGFFLQSYLLNLKIAQSQCFGADFRAVFLQFLFSDLFFFIVIVLCFLVLRNTIVQPIKKLTKLCQKINKGELTTEVIETDIQEIHELITTFTKMIEDLKRHRSILEETNKILEIKVKARTQELENLTAHLEDTVKERTKELEKKLKELETFHRVAVGRELKMIQLKKEIERLKAELKKYKDKTP
jgi:nitrate/nitrite-specific signal transduction histidine kinase